MIPDPPDMLADDRELLLLVACLRPLAAPGRTGAISHAAAAPFHADRLIDLAHRHRVDGFVEQGLAAIDHALPAEAAARLARSAARARLQSLRNAGEEIRIGRAFAAAGVDALFVKGSTLAMCVHGTLSIKTAWDIDVLIDRDRWKTAGRVLEGLGYRLSILGGITDPVQIDRYLAAHKEAEWHHAGRGTVVELHTGFSDTPAAIAGVGLGSPRMMVDLAPGAALPTLGRVPLFAYLSFHGTAHLWSRLKWLADVAALLHGADVEALYRKAIALGAGRCPGVTLVLAHELLGLAVPEKLQAEILRDRGTRRLLRYSRRAILAPEDAEGRLMRPLGELAAQARAQSWLVPGFAYRWAVVRGFLTRPYLPVHLRAPRWMMPGVILVVLPVRMMLRSIRRWSADSGR